MTKLNFLQNLRSEKQITIKLDTNKAIKFAISDEGRFSASFNQEGFGKFRPTEGHTLTTLRDLYEIYA